MYDKEGGLHCVAPVVSWGQRVYVAEEDRVCACQKRPSLHGKRDLLTWQNRPTHMAKETYLHGKRGLSTFAYLGARRPTSCHER